MYNVNTLWISGLILILSLAFAIFWYYPRNSKMKAMVAQIGAKEWQIEIADSPTSRIRGLSYRDDLLADKAMLFVFDEPGYYGIWMLGMKFPIDIIFIDQDMKIVDVFRDIKPDTYPASFKPSQKALYVLEMNSGESKELKIGDLVNLR